MPIAPEVIHRERYDRFIETPAWQILTSAAHNQKADDVLTLEKRLANWFTLNPQAKLLVVINRYNCYSTLEKY